MDANLERLVIVKGVDLGLGHCQFMYDQLKERMHRMDLHIKQAGRRVQVDLHNQITFFYPILIKYTEF